MMNKKYTFSFTGASAVITETMIVADQFQNLQDWEAVRLALIEKNLLNKIKEKTFRTVFSEIKKRLSFLSSEQLYLLINGSHDEAKSMILIAIVKTYEFFKDFINEVVRNKYLLFDRNLTDTDYIIFLTSKLDTHPELSNITEITAKKVKQVVYKVLEQVGLITHAKSGLIVRPLLSAEAISVIVRDDPSLLSAFLYSNEEIKALVENYL